MTPKLTDFIMSGRERFETKQRNTFAVVFAEVGRYDEFLRVITERYKVISQAFVENAQATRESFQPEAGRVTSAQMQLLEQGRTLSMELHLEIESFYLFAKILLDKIAAACEFYFGQARSLPLSSHSKLVKNINGYIEAKGIASEDRFIELGKKLGEHVSGFRDKQISHLRNPRAIRGTMFDKHGSTRLSVNTLYPTQQDKQHDTRALDELSEEIESYIQSFIAFVEKNRCETALALTGDRLS